MSKALLKESFDIKKANYTKKDGSVKPVLYIEAGGTDNTYAVKDMVKKNFGAMFFNKKWMWWIPNDQNALDELMNNKIIPCQKYLLSVEEKGTNGEGRDVISVIDNLIKIVSSSSDENMQYSGDLLGKLDKLKLELMNAVSADEFKKRLEPIIKFRNAQGAGYSFMNSILIYLQNKKAKMVKSKTNWFAANRGIKSGAEPIALVVPVGKKSLTPEQRKDTKNIYLRNLNKTEEELTVGEREILKKKLNGTVASSFKPVASFYDISDTYVLSGKEDLVGDPNKIDNIEWYDKKNGEDPKTVKLCDAAIMFAQKERKLSVRYSDDLGGARGVSDNHDTITLLKGEKKGAGMLNTICHETAHELLHFRYANMPVGNYFIGTEEGRGIVEQQAELTAWIVLRTFGLDSPTSINYMGIWGMDEKNAVKVFDTVAGAATAIIKGIQKYLGNINENKMTVNEITGYEVANLIGCGDIYNKSKKENQTEDSENSEINEIKNDFLTYLKKLNKI